MEILPFQTRLVLSLAVTHEPVAASAWTNIAREAKYRPQAVAQLCCVSFRTIQRHFRKHYQTTFTTWLREHRMEEARSRILAGDSLKKICFDLGYKQPSHFTRVFKQHFGFPPSQLSATRQYHLPLLFNNQTPPALFSSTPLILIDDSE
jgi:AraC-like DNA-binding protein